jgi:transcriptional regulator with XRE-family HTH domain
MRLRQYLSDGDITFAAFAALIGVSTQAVHRYAMGERMPRREIMERIRLASRGKVQPNDFFEAPTPACSEAA